MVKPLKMADKGATDKAECSERGRGARNFAVTFNTNGGEPVGRKGVGLVMRYFERLP